MISIRDGFRAALFLSFALVVALPALAQDTPEVQLASDGTAKMEIVIPEGASKRVKDAANDLAGMLKRITGADFTVSTGGDGQTGIVLGVCTDFPELAEDIDFKPDEPFKRDCYLLRSHEGGLYMIGASDMAVQHAVWDLLHRFGYRLFFLTDTWEVVPDQRDLRISIDTFEEPDYVTREGPRGAPWSNRELWARWKKRNRINSAFKLNTGHSYDGIIDRHEEEFEEHPEYLALRNGKRGGNKFCISNPGLRKLVVDDAIRQVKNNPDRDSISLDPSDGGGWCECGPCKEMGSVTDRVVTLANEAAESINQLGMGRKYVGIYGYASHSIPPNIKVHPNVIVSLATAFIRGGYNIDMMLEGWSKQDATLGIREYHDVFTWSHDRPRSARGGSISYLVRTIPHFHKNNARFMNSQAMDSWGANGFGYWISPILLWDISQAEEEEVDKLFEDFLDKSFGSAKEPMRRFYERVNFRKYPFRTIGDRLARFYRRLQEATELTDDEKVIKRLEDLILYTRYLELYHIYRRASSQQPDSTKAINLDNLEGLQEEGANVSAAGMPALSPRQEAYNNLSIHVLRMTDRYMVSSYAIVTRERYRDGSIAPYANFAELNKKAASAPADELALEEPEEPVDPATIPFTREEIMSILKAGVENHQPVELDFEPVEFSEELVAVGPVPPTEPGNYRLGEKPSRLGGRGTMAYYIWVDEPATIEIGVTGGLIAHYRDRGNVRLALYSPKEEMGEPVAQDQSVPPDGKEYIVQLKTPFSGLHRLVVRDGYDKTLIKIPAGMPVTVGSGLEDRPRGWPGRRGHAYFYVPKGTENVGGFTRETNARLLDQDGGTIFEFDSMDAPGFFSVKVPVGKDGQYWQIDAVKQTVQYRHLMTVPPYLARSPELLLLPREVVEKDFKDTK